MMQFLDATMLLGIAVALLFVCVLMLLVQVDRNNKRYLKQIEEMRRENVALQEKLSKQLSESWQEARANTEAVSDSVTRALTEMALKQNKDGHGAGGMSE